MRTSDDFTVLWRSTPKGWMACVTYPFGDILYGPDPDRSVVEEAIRLGVDEDPVVRTTPRGAGKVFGDMRRLALTKQATAVVAKRKLWDSAEGANERTAPSTGAMPSVVGDEDVEDLPRG